MTKSFSLFRAAALGLSVSGALALPALAERVSVLVFDASGSMWNRVEGDRSRIEVARDVMGDYFARRDGSLPLSVIAYGHNRRGDCRDIEVIAPMGRAAPGALESRLRGLMPRGMTPLTDSLALARRQIPATAEAADIILVTDGLETCDGDPCALAADLAAEGIDIRAHVVGFGLSRVEVEALACITEQTGGMLFQTHSGAELADALQQVSAPPPAPAPVAESGPVAPPVLTNRFVFREVGAGTPRGLMDWRAEGEDGTVIALGSTEGTLQSLEGISADLPAGIWRIVAEGAEGRAEAMIELRQCCGSHGVPFTGNAMVAVIPPLGQVQAGMAARLPFEITHPGTGHLGGTPYKVIATGPEGTLTNDQIVRRDLITSRAPGLTGGSTGALEPGAYRMMIVIARSGGYEILAERRFEAVEAPVVGIVAPDRAAPGAQIEVSMNGGYATAYVFAVVDDNDRTIGQGQALYMGAGGGGGGTVIARLGMPDREGVFDLVIRRGGRGADRDEILARRPIAIGALPDPTQGSLQQDAIAPVPATFRLPPGLPDSPVGWDAVPLDPDMQPEAWAPTGTGPVITGAFEPGRWRVTAQAPGGALFRADVPIFPGQENDFVLPMLNDSEAGAAPIPSLGGGWQVLGIPPWQVQAPAQPLLSLTLAQEAPLAAASGRWSAHEALAGPDAAGREGALSAIRQEADGLTRMEFTLGPPVPEPFLLSVRPQGPGYVGSLSSGALGVRVALWPAGQIPPLAGLRAALHGPAPADFVDMTAAVPPEVAPETGPELAFVCRQPVCDIAGAAHGIALSLPQGWGMTEPGIDAPAGAGQPMIGFHGPDGAELRLNPRQWLDSNGPCTATALGPLCHFAADPVARIAAPFIGGSLRADPAGARFVPLDLGGISPEKFLEFLSPRAETE